MSVFINKVSTHKEMEDCINIRKIVFIESQNVPVELELDGLDNESDHYLLKLDGIASGTARIRICIYCSPTLN